MKRSILIPIDPEPEEPSRDLEQELKEAQAKIKQLESVLHYGVEMGKMVPRFEYMVLEAKVEEAKFQQAAEENSKQPSGWLNYQIGCGSWNRRRATLRGTVQRILGRARRKSRVETCTRNLRKQHNNCVS